MVRKNLPPSFVLDRLKGRQRSVKALERKRREVSVVL
jgi:hypothetical protein